MKFAFYNLPGVIPHMGPILAEGAVPNLEWRGIQQRETAQKLKGPAENNGRPKGVFCPIGPFPALYRRQIVCDNRNRRLATRRNRP
jgi:hypothetical protein